MKKTKLYATIIGLVGVLGGTLITIPLAQAADTATTNTWQKPTAAGEITAIDGNVVTLKDETTGKLYTINVADASMQKVVTDSGSSTSTPPLEMKSAAKSDLKVGDRLEVQGTVSGSSITPTKIVDGQTRPNQNSSAAVGSQSSQQKPDGQIYTVTAISGTTLTVTDKNGTTYTVDISSAKINNGPSGSDTIIIGKQLMISGTVSGTSVTATSVAVLNANINSANPPQAK